MLETGLVRRERKELETNLAERERDKLKTSAVMWLNIIVRAQAGEISKDVEIRWEQKITETGETLGKTKPKRTPAKWPGPEVVLLTDLVRRLKCRTSPRWVSLARRQAGIAVARPASRNPRKSQQSPKSRTVTVRGSNSL
jgi:hypothetical protein